MAEVLIIEPFYGGSHKQMVDLLQSKLDNCDVVTMTAKKWQWRARTSALYLSQQINHNHRYKVLFTSSVLNLSELVSLRLDLQRLKKILYFHENQLVYPVKKQQDRDFQYGYNQILSCMVADVVVFNSSYNMNSFLDSIQIFIKLIPDYRPKGLADVIRPKCSVLYFPLNLPSQDCVLLHHKEKIGDGLYNQQSPNSHDKDQNLEEKPLHIVWAHRWEHDKDPETFFTAMTELSETGLSFKLSVLGEQFTDVPEIFEVAKERLTKHIVHWGYQERKTDYIGILKSADVSVSTAIHEFFGVSMLESVYYGCYPLCPNRLVYPEIFPEAHLYNTPKQLTKSLKRFCKFPVMVRNQPCKVAIERYLWSSLEADYLNLFTIPDSDGSKEDDVT